ncbi:MAG: hypothetical protein HY329_06275, partial [Chloroflexi bacterium]|nr:hypothetical protein [Chloroflexota bacterium]
RLIAGAMGLDAALPPGPAGQAAADGVGVRVAQLPEIAEDAYGDIPIARNPRRVESPAEILALLRAAW